MIFKFEREKNDISYLGYSSFLLYECSRERLWKLANLHWK